MHKYVTLCCRTCNEDFGHLPRTRGRYPVYCSETCRGFRAPFACVICGAAAVAQRGLKATCASDECKRSHRRNRYYARKARRPERECRRPGCGNTISGLTDQKTKYCSTDCRRQGSYERKCAGCAGMFAASDQNKRFCTQECLWDWRRVGLFPKPTGEKSYRARAERFGVKYETVIRSRVFERDAWTCGICDTPVDSGLKYPDPMSVSLDHVVPMCAGGTHTYDNVQCSHLYCNVTKNDGTRNHASQDAV
jgi:hypothetical protein